MGSPATEAAPAAALAALARLALAEDGPRDLTSLVTIGADDTATAALELRHDAVVAGQAFADAVLAECGLPPATWMVAEGTACGAGVIGQLQGNLRALLRAERPLLNGVQRATGIATLTRRYVQAVAGTGCTVLHTRKTAPGLRVLDLAAVRAGGGGAHRAGLDAVVMVKDNHWQGLARNRRALRDALAEARALGAAALHVEVEREAQLEEACRAGATRLLVDNQLPETVRRWGEAARALAPGIEIEATGGITLENVRTYAEAGADFVSIGALTHSVEAADVGMTVDSRR